MEIKNTNFVNDNNIFVNKLKKKKNMSKFN